MHHRYVDILVVTDARLVGGGNKSIAQEIIAQAAAGYTTGLISLAGPAKGGARPLDQSLMRLIQDGRLQVFRPDEPLEAKLVIARGPSMFGTKQPFNPQIRAEQWMIIANAFNSDPAVSSLLYDPTEVARQAENLFGHQWTWVPLSTIVRQNISSVHPKLPLSPMTWTNIINSNDWRVERPDKLGRPIRLGRHSRDAPGKWPENPQTILDAYPESPEFEVTIMGGASVPKKTLGRLPENWNVKPFGGMGVHQFLKQIDIYPYYHHSAMHEAFGRAVLEAISTGVIAILPQYFEAIFADAAIYAQASEVRQISTHLANAPEYLAERREAAYETIERHFSYGSHVERLRNIIGRPRRGQSTNGMKTEPTPSKTPTKPRVLFFTDNGHGLGHVTRLLAYAKRLKTDVQAHFLTMSEAYHLVAEQGFPVEYFPSAKKLNFSAERKPAWEQLLYRRLRSILDRLQPGVVVVDHVNPPEILRSIREEYRDTVFIWSRRGLWRQHRKPAGIRMSDAFDYVLEPMDLASAIDMGFTPRLSENTYYVPPISLVERDETLSRDQAREQLGLPAEGTSILLNLSADSTQQLVYLISRIEGLLAKHFTREASFTIFAPRHALHSEDLQEVAHVIMKQVYPVAKYANAFDAAISTAGYNSFHELVHLGIPSIFVARATNTLDDQNRRAGFAAIAGFGQSAQSVEGIEFESAVKAIAKPGIRGRMKAAALEAFPVNGARQVARFIESILELDAPENPKLDSQTPDEELSGLIERKDHMTQHIRRNKLHAREKSPIVSKQLHLSALEEVSSGSYLPLNAYKNADRILIDATEFDRQALEDLTENFSLLQVLHPYIKPFFLISALDPSPLNKAGFVYETIVDEVTWKSLWPLDSYRRYQEDRFKEMIRTYMPQKMVQLQPQDVIPCWIYER